MLWRGIGPLVPSACCTRAAAACSRPPSAAFLYLSSCCLQPAQPVFTFVPHLLFAADARRSGKPQDIGKGCHRIPPSGNDQAAFSSPPYIYLHPPLIPHAGAPCRLASRRAAPLNAPIFQLDAYFTRLLSSARAVSSCRAPFDFGRTSLRRRMLALPHHMHRSRTKRMAAGASASIAQALRPRRC